MVSLSDILFAKFDRKKHSSEHIHIGKMEVYLTLSVSQTEIDPVKSLLPNVPYYFWLTYGTIEVCEPTSFNIGQYARNTDIRSVITSLIDLFNEKALQLPSKEYQTMVKTYKEYIEEYNKDEKLTAGFHTMVKDLVGIFHNSF